METTLTGLIVIMLLLLVVLTLAHAFLSVQSAALDSWRDTEARLTEQARTDLLSLGGQTLAGGALVEIGLQNSGSVKLADFDRWDVIVQYQDSLGGHHVDWLPYSQAGDRWTVKGIYLDASQGTAEFFEPNILNGGEELVIQMTLSSWVGSGTTNLATVVTPNGIGVSTVFTY
ncbi:MAG: hypothetical protein ACOYZ7_12385 [Chloroflexota bacterium]